MYSNQKTNFIFSLRYWQTIGGVFFLLLICLFLAWTESHFVAEKKHQHPTQQHFYNPKEKKSHSDGYILEPLIDIEPLIDLPSRDAKELEKSFWG
ncbi:MAG: hypothetical protein JJT94_04035 [Bernardetiaceae bacterium]|nr:hypothetical protein [Bernardetiaceae bacterium]